MGALSGQVTASSQSGWNIYGTAKKIMPEFELNYLLHSFFLISSLRIPSISSLSYKIFSQSCLSWRFWATFCDFFFFFFQFGVLIELELKIHGSFCGLVGPPAMRQGQKARWNDPQIHDWGHVIHGMINLHEWVATCTPTQLSSYLWHGLSDPISPYLCNNTWLTEANLGWVAINIICHWDNSLLLWVLSMASCLAIPTSASVMDQVNLLQYREDPNAMTAKVVRNVVKYGGRWYHC